MNNELESTVEEAVMTYFTVLFLCFPQELVAP
jgi:hypothetical protein